MFTLLGGEPPLKPNFTAIGNIDGKYIEYKASRTKEMLNIYADVHLNEILGSIYVNKPSTSIEAEGERVQVAGDWEDFSYLIGVHMENGNEAPLLHETELKEGRSANKFVKTKKLKYKMLNDVYYKYDVETNGNSIEDFLYRTRPITEIAKEKGISLEWVKEKNYRILTDTNEIKNYISGLALTNEIVGFDTETTGLMVNSSRKDELVGICLSYEDNTGVYFPLQHERIENVEMGMENLIEMLRPYIDRNAKLRKKLVTHNGYFDWRVMKTFDIDLNVVFDTFIRYSLLDVRESKGLRGLKSMASRMLNIEVLELNEMYEKRSKQDILAVHDAVFKQNLYVNPITKYKLNSAVEWGDLQYDFRFASKDFVEIYGSADADFPRLIHKILDEEWDDSLDFVYNLEIGVIPAIGEQEYYGVKAIQEEYINLYHKTKDKLEALENKIYKEAGRKFDIGSPAQKSKVLFEDLKCPILSRFYTKKGQLSASTKVLEVLSEYKNPDGTSMYPIANYLQEHAKLTKLQTSFYGKLPKLIHAEHLYPSYMAFGAETGRFSCSNPNLQQTEPSSRSYMIPDSDDYYFLICDYSQVEYRVMAGLSQERKVVDFFNENPEADYHIMAVSNMMNIPYEDVTSKQRKLGKKLNFGTTYGLHDENLAINLYGNSTPFHQMLARNARKQYFEGIPVLRDYFEHIRDVAQEKGYAETMFGRKRYINSFLKKNPSQYDIQSGRRQAGNMPVQGSSADIQKMALTRIYHGFKKRGHNEHQARLVMNIHDEVVVQVHKSLNMWYALSIIKEAMEIDLSHLGFPPLYIGANVGYNWKDGKDDNLEAPVLLMKEKVDEVNNFLKSGKTWRDLPTTDKPKEEWLEEIQKFALRQVKEEIQKNNICSLSDFRKAKRAVKYASVFNREVMSENPENSEKPLKFKISNENIIFETVKEKGVDYTFENIQAILETEDIEFVETVKEKTKGEILQENTEMLNDLVKRHIKVNNQSKKILIKLQEADGGFFTQFNKMVVPYDSVKMFKNDLTDYSIVVEIGNTREQIKFKKLFKNFLPLVIELMKTHLVGGNYRDIEDDVIEIGDSLMAS